MKTKTKALTSGILLFVTLIINAMGASGFINGYSQKEVSDMYLTLLTPAPYTFSIWSVIYALLIISIIAMLVKHNDNYYKAAIDKISYLFWATSIFNMLWIITFSYKLIWLSVIFILVLLALTIVIVKKIGDIQAERPFLLPITFGLYSGWLFIATVVNIVLWLVAIQWHGFVVSAELWSIIILLASTVLVLIVATRMKNPIFPLPIAWAYLGIYNNLLAPEGFDNQYFLLPYIALLGMVFLIAIAAIQFYKNNYCLVPKQGNIEV